MAQNVQTATKTETGSWEQVTRGEEHQSSGQTPRVHRQLQPVTEVCPEAWKPLGSRDVPHGGSCSRPAGRRGEAPGCAEELLLLGHRAGDPHCGENGEIESERNNDALGLAHVKYPYLDLLLISGSAKNSSALAASGSAWCVWK